MISYIALLASSTIVWGFGFIAVRLSFESYDPYWSHALRFIIAGILGLPVLFYLKSFSRKDTPWKEGFIGASYLTGTLLFQTLGLSFTTVAKSGFITTLYSFFVPLTMMVVYKKKYNKKFWFLVILALIGMALLCNLEINDLNRGDLLILICSLFASFHIIYIGLIANRIKSSIEYNFIQNIFVGFQGLLIAFFVKGQLNIAPMFNIHSNTFKGIMFLSIISSMIAFTIQVIAQKKIPPHIASLVFLLESPFAAWFGYIFFKETLNGMNIVGACLILISVILVPVLGREVTAVVKE
jgi:drug/metabolite transporter (DMT)-like permease